MNIESYNLLSFVLTIIIAGSAIWQSKISDKQKQLSLFNLRLDHYRKFAKIIEIFIELDKCKPEDYYKTCDDIELQLRYCTQEAKFLFTEEVANLENEIFIEFKNFKEICGDIEDIKNEIFNNIVRTKYKNCREKMEELLGKML